MTAHGYVTDEAELLHQIRDLLAGPQNVARVLEQRADELERMLTDLLGRSLPLSFSSEMRQVLVHEYRILARAIRDSSAGGT